MPLLGGAATPYLTQVHNVAWADVYLGMEVGLSRGDFVFDWDPASPPQKRGGAPSLILGPFLWWPNGWRHQDATWYGGRPQPRRLCVPPPPKGGKAASPIFGPFLVWPNGCVHQNATWYRASLGPGEFVLDGDPIPLSQSGTDP